MSINLRDKSLYLQGMFVLIGKDSVVSPEENKMVMHMGKLLQFSTEFCQETIQNLLQNEYIGQLRPVFSDVEFSKIFLKDAIKLAFADNQLHSKEYEWLKEVARRNKISDEWLSFQLSSFLNMPETDEKKTLEIERLYNKQATFKPFT